MERILFKEDWAMWNVIGGFVVSSVVDVFVKEIVKEIGKPKSGVKPRIVKASDISLKHSSGQVMLLDWVAQPEGHKPRKARSTVKKKVVTNKAG